MERTRALGAEVVLHGNVYDEAYDHAVALGAAADEISTYCQAK